MQKGIEETQDSRDRTLELDLGICCECQAWLNFVRDHGWDKCRVRTITGEPDPTDEQIDDFEDGAAMYFNHMKTHLELLTV